MFYSCFSFGKRYKILEVIYCGNCFVNNLSIGMKIWCYCLDGFFSSSRIVGPFPRSLFFFLIWFYICSRRLGFYITPAMDHHAMVQQKETMMVSTLQNYLRRWFHKDEKHHCGGLVLCGDGAWLAVPYRRTRWRQSWRRAIKRHAHFETIRRGTYLKNTDVLENRRLALEIKFCVWIQQCLLATLQPEKCVFGIKFPKTRSQLHKNMFGTTFPKITLLVFVCYL